MTQGNTIQPRKRQVSKTLTGSSEAFPFRDHGQTVEKAEAKMEVARLTDTPRVG